MNRNRFFVEGKLDAISSGTIVDWNFPWHGELVQFSVHFSAAPTTSENLVITKVHPTDTDFNTIVRSIDLQGVQDLVCPDVFQFRYAENILVSYPNTDGLVVALQLVTKEIG